MARNATSVSGVGYQRRRPGRRGGPLAGPVLLAPLRPVPKLGVGQLRSGPSSRRNTTARSSSALPRPGAARARRSSALRREPNRADHENRPGRTQQQRPRTPPVPSRTSATTLIVGEVQLSCRGEPAAESRHLAAVDHCGGGLPQDFRSAVEIVARHHGANTVVIASRAAVMCNTLAAHTRSAVMGHAWRQSRSLCGCPLVELRKPLPCRTWRPNDSGRATQTRGHTVRAPRRSSGLGGVTAATVHHQAHAAGIVSLETVVVPRAGAQSLESTVAAVAQIHLPVGVRIAAPQLAFLAMSCAISAGRRMTWAPAASASAAIASSSSSLRRDDSRRGQVGVWRTRDEWSYRRTCEILTDLLRTATSRNDSRIHPLDLASTRRAALMSWPKCSSFRSAARRTHGFRMRRPR